MQAVMQEEFSLFGGETDFYSVQGFSGLNETTH
jgi:hypothetical protein